MANICRSDQVVPAASSRSGRNVGPHGRRDRDDGSPRRPSAGPALDRWTLRSPPAGAGAGNDRARLERPRLERPRLEHAHRDGRPIRRGGAAPRRRGATLPRESGPLVTERPTGRGSVGRRGHVRRVSSGCAPNLARERALPFFVRQPLVSAGGGRDSRRARNTREPLLCGGPRPGPARRGRRGRGGALRGSSGARGRHVRGLPRHPGSPLRRVGQLHALEPAHPAARSGRPRGGGGARGGRRARPTPYGRAVRVLSPGVPRARHGEPVPLPRLRRRDTLATLHARRERGVPGG